MAAEVNKPNFSFQWASGGSIVAPSDVKIQTGWTAEVPPFQWENFLQNRQDNAILHLFQKGISEWDAASNYYFTSSGVRSYVQGSDGNIYIAVADSIGQDPVTDTAHTFWDVAFRSGTLIAVRTFTTNGTYTPTVGTKTIIVEGVGGGASGGGSAATTAGQVSAGGGGGNGAYAKGRFTTGFAGLAIVIGAGGAPGAAGGNGLAGGSTSLGGIFSCPGGIPGGLGAALTPPQVGGSSAGPGTPPTGGNIVSCPGGVGLPGIALAGGYGGPGADSMFGKGGWAPIAVDGRTGVGFGSGSSGSFSPGSTGSARASVAGQPGILIIHEYA
jgi:hypothetical protein